MLIKCTIFYTKRCMYEQKWEYSYKETPVLANAGSGVFLIKGFFYSPYKRAKRKGENSDVNSGTY